MTYKEFREFFLRATSINFGGKKDQELGFATTRKVNINGVIKTVGNRFLNEHYPDESVFRKLFESITFKLNTEDSATTTQQGLVSLATSSQVIAGTLLNSNGYPIVPRPSDIQRTYLVSTFPNSGYKLNDIFIITDPTSRDYGKIGILSSTSPFTITEYLFKAPLRYNLRLTQTSRDAPVETKLLNNTGFDDIVWARTDTGVYTGTSEGLFKNAVILSQGVINIESGSVCITRTSDDIITINTYNAEGVADDNILSNYSLQIDIE